MSGVASAPLTSFIGIDLAWNINAKHSGIAVMEGDERQVCLKTVSLNLTSMVGVVEYVTSHSGADTVVAIDASLVVRNPVGQRPCEKRISENFGKYHASCHSTNLARLHARTGMKLVSELADHGFVHDFDVGTATRGVGPNVPDGTVSITKCMIL